MSVGFIERNALAFFALLYASGAALYKGIGFLLFMWLAHSLTVEEYASFGLLYALQVMLAAFAAAGVVEVIIGLLRMYSSPALRNKLFGAANAVFYMLSTAFFCALLLFGTWLIDFLNTTSFVIFSVVLCGLLTAFFTMQAQLLRLDEKHLQSFLLGFVPPLAGILGGGAGVFLTGTSAGFFIGFAVSGLLSFLPFGFFRVGYYSIATDVQTVRRIGFKISPYVLIGLILWLNGYGVNYLVQSFFSTTDVARFMFAYTLSSIIQLVATSLNQVWSPRVFRMIHEVPASEVDNKSRPFFILQGLILGLVGAVILILEPIAVILVGDSLKAYSDLTTELYFLFAAYALTLPWYQAQNYYFAHANGAQLLNVTLVSSVLGVLSWFVSIWFFGVLGVYIGFMLVMMIRALGTFYWARSKWFISILWEGVVIAIAFMTAGLYLSDVVIQWLL